MAFKYWKDFIKRKNFMKKITIQLLKQEEETNASLAQKIFDALKNYK